VFRIYPTEGPRCDVLKIISIFPDGRYSLCGIGVTHKEITFGHIDKDDIDSIWMKNPLLREMRTIIPYSGKEVCLKCIEYKNCYSHCMAYSITKYGSLNGPFPICQEAYENGFFPKDKLKQNEYN